MQQIQSWQAFVEHWQTMQQQQQRYLLVVPECDATYELLLPMLAATSPLPKVGVNLKQSVLGADAAYIKPNQAKQMLGLNRGLLVYRAVDEFNVSAFSALCGTLVGGSFAVLIVPGEGSWHGYQDQQCQDFGCLDGQPSQAFRVWWQGVWQASEGVCYVPVSVQSKAQPLAANEHPYQAPQVELNLAQVQLVDEVLALSLQEQQIIWLTGPRGRGKSVAIGKAIEALRQQGSAVLITASASHSSRLVAEVGADYYAVDRLLLDSDLQADVLVVEEASSMPLYMLVPLLKRFAKLVLVSTVDGYEGTGQGLKLKLPAMLNKLGLGCKLIELHKPLRWQPEDLLEQLIEDSFLPRQLAPIGGPINLNQLSVQVLKSGELIEHQDLLQQVYSLLALAHYQTTPQDLRLLLDHPNLTLHLLLQPHSKQLVGVACVMAEGDLDKPLAQQIANGKRRLKGQLLPQILAQQAGMASMAQARMLRVQRIAVHPHLQGQGLGSLLLQHVQRWGRQQQATYLGSSFAAEPEVVRFWLQAGYEPVWAGLRPDGASGLPSLQVLLPLTEPTPAYHALRQHWYFFSQILQRCWAQGLPSQLRTTYKGVPIDLVKQSLQQVGFEFGNAYALGGYLLQWVLAQDKLDDCQQRWLASYPELSHKHKQFVALTRQLVQQHWQAIEAQLDRGLMALKVDHA